MSAHTARLPKGPPARPPRHDKVTVKLSAVEIAKLHRLATDAGLSMAAWLRKAVLEEAAARGIGE